MKHLKKALYTLTYTAIMYLDTRRRMHGDEGKNDGRIRKCKVGVHHHTYKALRKAPNPPNHSLCFQRRHLVIGRRHRFYSTMSLQRRWHALFSCHLALAAELAAQITEPCTHRQRFKAAVPDSLNCVVCVSRRIFALCCVWRPRSPTGNPATPDNILHGMTYPI